MADTSKPTVIEKVDTPHPMYAELEMKRDVFRAVKSTDAIQAKGETFLPKYPAEDPKEYMARCHQSTIDGIVSGGVDTLTGAVFFGDIDTSKVNSQIVPLLENIDNKGNHFNVFARRAFEAAFDGSAVILIDRPNPKGADGKPVPITSAGDERALKLRTYWRLYYACDVINWRYRVNPVSQATELELIVLHEVSDEPINTFEVKPVTRYRVYTLSMNQVVSWQLYKKIEETGQQAKFQLEDFGTLSGYTAIPLAVIGELEDEPKLLVESRLEIKAYQKESSFDVIEYLSIPVFYTIGYPDDGAPLALGANTHLRLPLGSTGSGQPEVGFAQIDSAGHISLKETISGIKEYIKGRLNELVTSTSGPEKTATQSSIEDRDKQARLIVWAEQFKDALELALSFTAQSMGLGEDQGGEIILNTKWEVEKQRAEEAKEQQLKSDEANIAATLAKAKGNE